MGVLASLRRKATRRERSTVLSGEPLVSIVVPAFNEGSQCRQDRKHSAEEHIPNVEIVFVDDGSNDRTCQLVEDAFPPTPGLLL